MSNTPLIGIDLGTSKFCAAIFQKDKIEIIPNDIGERTTPSYVAFTDKENLVGDTAKNQMHRNASNTLFSIKRLIGRKFEDNDIQNMIKYYPFKIIKDEHSERIKIEININNEKKQFFVEEILEMEMLKIKEEVSKYLGKEIKDIIIGVPNSFTFMQRKIIKEAASKCGLNCIRVVGESNLSSLSHAFNQQIDKMEENILIFDFGAGFLNVSVTSNEDGLIEIKSVNGLSNLGGEDFDNKLIEYCLNEFKSKKGVDKMNIMNNPRALRRLRTECEKAKKILSSCTKTVAEIFDLMDGKDLIIEITRDIFEDLCIDLFKKCLIPIENVLKDANMNKSQIDTIILTGGSSRIPKIQSMIKEYFNGFDDIIQLNSDEVVSSGAAIQTAIISNIHHKKIEMLSFLDICPHSIGFETTGGIMNVIIPRGYNIPFKKTDVFFTRADNQEEMLIQIYEGEKKLTKDNLLIDKIEEILPLSSVEFAGWASMQVGAFLLSGINCEADPVKAWEWLAMASETYTYIPAGMQALMIMLEMAKAGEEIDTDYLKERATLIDKYPEVSEDPVNGVAVLDLAEVYEEGKYGIEKDYNKALDLYHKAKVSLEKQLAVFTTEVGKKILNSSSSIQKDAAKATLNERVAKAMNGISRIEKQQQL